MAMEAESSMKHRDRVGCSSINVVDIRGKHRLLAELKRLEHETRFLEEELEELDKTAKGSAVCQELLPSVESRPDPLLQETNGPVNPTWDRWFEGPQDSQICRCCFFGFSLFRKKSFKDDCLGPIYRLFAALSVCRMVKGLNTCCSNAC